MPYETAVDLGNFIAALRQADLVHLKWGDRGMLCWIINRAKEAISQGDEEIAYTILAEITQSAHDHRTQH